MTLTDLITARLNGDDPHEITTITNAEAIEIRGELERLRAEVSEAHEDAFVSISYYTDEGEMAGWYDSGAMSTACEHGDWLVENAGWEIHPKGYGRRWFYRPPQAKETAQ